MVKLRSAATQVPQKTQKAPGKKTNPKSNVNTPTPTPTPKSGCKAKKQEIGAGVETGACVECGRSEGGALQCEGCPGEVWKCIECLNIPSDMFEALQSGNGTELRWYCDCCTRKEPTSQQTQSQQEAQLSKLTEIHDKVGLLLDRMLGFEEKLGQKADIARVDEMSIKLNSIDSRMAKIEEAFQENQKRDNDIEQKLQQADKQVHNIDEKAVIDCIEKRLEQRENDDEEERAERDKRKTSLIVHGIKELDSENAEERISHDSDEITNLMIEIGCELVQIEKVTRLGKPRRVSKEEDAATTDKKVTQKPRPIKIVLNSEEQKLKVLKGAKNLKKPQEGEKQAIIIHQDLTLKEREARNKLWSQLKERRQNGEPNLIIAKGKIVSKWW